MEPRAINKTVQTIGLEDHHQLFMDIHNGRWEPAREELEDAMIRIQTACVFFHPLVRKIRIWVFEDNVWRDLG